MSTKLIYLGPLGKDVLIALADLNDLSPRKVPVKLVPSSFLNTLDTADLQGFVRGGRDVYAHIFVRVATVDMGKLSPGVYISGCGELRVFHPAFKKDMEGYVFIERRNVPYISAKRLLFSVSDDDFENFYTKYAYVDERSCLISACQKLLLYGLSADIGEKSSFYNATLNVTGIWIPDETLNIHTFRMLNRGKNCYNFTHMPNFTRIRTLYGGGHTCFRLTGEVDTLICEAYTDLNFDLGGVNVQKVITTRKDTDGKSVIKITSLPRYNGEDMLRDAEGVTLNHCFSATGINHSVDGDVYIPPGARLTNCFFKNEIIGRVVAAENVVMFSSFSECIVGGDVQWWGEGGEAVYTFSAARIRGKADLIGLKEIKSSFDGEIGGSVLLNENLRALSGMSFRSHADMEYTIKGDDFHAGLIKEGATLNVHGREGIFEGVKVKTLNWVTDVEEVQAGQFSSASVSTSNVCDSVLFIRKAAYREFSGSMLDFGVYTNLAEIEGGAVTGAQFLTNVAITGSVNLRSGAFKKCPRLEFIYIGDDVRGITAGVFTECAALIKIYYNQNKEVERLAKVARFELIPNSTQEAFFVNVEEKAHQRELDGTVATLKGEDCSFEMLMKIHGFDESLSEKYAVVYNRSVPIDTYPHLEVVLERMKRVQVGYAETKMDIFMGILSRAYVCCDVALNHIPDEAESVRVVVATSSFALLRSELWLNNEPYFVYWLVDLNERIVVHAFTVGPENDHVGICANFNLAAVDEMPTAMMRYADENELAKDHSFLSAWSASWLPFGIFRLGTVSGTVWGMYGVDLYSGEMYAYRLKSVSTHLVRQPLESAQPLYVAGILDGFALRYNGTLAQLKPLCLPPLALLERLVGGGDGVKVKQVDTTRILLANDRELSLNVQKLLEKGYVDMTAQEAKENLIRSELFRGKVRLNDKEIRELREIHFCELREGGFSVTRDYANIRTILKFKDGEFLVSPFLHTCLKKALFALCAERVDVDVKENIGHFTLADAEIEKGGNFIVLRSLHLRNYVSGGGSKQIVIGLSAASFKVCLAYAEYKYSREITIPVFWFNSLNDLYEALTALNCNVFSAIPWAPGHVTVERIRAFTNFAGNGTIAEARRMVLAGISGHVGRAAGFNQTIYDLACKQPRLRGKSKL
jgi:hypothetical protein